MATQSQAKDIPALPPGSLPQAVLAPLNRMREELQRLDGFIGDRLDMAVTWRALLNEGLISSFDGRHIGGGGGSIIVTPPGGGSGSTDPDLTPPPTPTNVVVSAGITYVFETQDAPTYTQGHGHGSTRIYGVQKDPTDATLPTFGDAALVYESFGPLTVMAFPSEPNRRWHLWVKWKSVDGVESTSPAGGTNGFTATTGQDIGHLLEVLSGQITEGELYKTLSARIDMIDAGTGMTVLYGFEAGTDGWVGSSATFTVADGIGTWTPTASNGSLRRTLSAPEQFTGDELPFIRARVRRVSGTGAWEGNLYYTSPTVPSFTSSFRKQVGQPADPDKWNVLEWDMRELTAGGTDYTASIITALRIDLVSDTGSVWEVDWIGLGENSATGTTIQIDHLANQYTVRAEVSASGQVVAGGFGLAGGTDDLGGPTIDFGVLATKFYVAAPAGSGSISGVLPFVVQTTDQTVNGVLIPKGVYMDAAYIKNLQAMVARLGSAWIDDAMIANLSAAKLTVGDGTVGGNLKSTNYVSGSTGWILRPNGTAQLPAASIIGLLTAAQIGANAITATQIAADAVTATKINVSELSAISADMGALTAGSIALGAAAGNFIRAGQTDYATGTGFFLGWSAIGTDGFKFSIGDADDYMRWDGTTLSIAGTLVGVDGTFSGTLTAGAVNAVNTINIAGNAITVPTLASQSSVVGLTVPPITLLTATAVNPGDGKVCVVITIEYRVLVADAEGGGSSAVPPTFELKRNGTTVATWEPNGGQTLFSTARGTSTYTHLDTPGGSAVYTVVAYDAPPGSTVFRRTMLILGVKR